MHQALDPVGLVTAAALDHDRAVYKLYSGRKQPKQPRLSAGNSVPANTVNSRTLDG